MNIQGERTVYFQHKVGSGPQIILTALFDEMGLPHLHQVLFEMVARFIDLVLSLRFESSEASINLSDWPLFYWAYI